ncbi:MAG: peptide deformylase [Mariprofundaceae bacterium]|nr:peptide deformylase [Mariprofundaceae bacterium]
MSIREVLRMGDYRLLAKAAPVSCFGSTELNTVIEDMRDTMDSLNGAGLAAPQIGVSLRVLIFGVHNNPRYPDAEDVLQTVLINPEIEVLEEAIEHGWEGCLSLPGLRGYVPRFKRIRYIGFDEHGVHIEREAEGFHARVVQHEYDHLNGILYPMRMNDMSRFGFEEVLNL